MPNVADTADMAEDPYVVLGVDPSASAEVITSAFRHLVRELRPDARVDAVTAERFGRLRTAYETLRDPGLRAAYDRTRAAPAPRPARAPRPAPAPPAPWPFRLPGLFGNPAPEPPLRAGPVRWERGS
ncbi:J domain-containing protein [Streptomyces bullii]|uniref:J domain-containing protein n=1 Tax=Streptomyces bullii TaxID=349910 RepID=A0ABW0UM75_9ACTN